MAFLTSLQALAELMDRVAAPYAGLCAGAIRAAIPLQGTTLNDETATRLAVAIQAAHLIREVHLTPLEGHGDRLRRALASTDLLVPPPERTDGARDELWELFLASRFIARGFGFQFAEDVMPKGSPKPEFFVKSGGRVFAIEAKRIRGDQLKKRVNKAVKQIQSACAGSYAEAGIMCLDVSFLTEVHAQRRRWSVASQADEELVRRTVRQRALKFAEKIAGWIRKHPGGKSVMGLVLFQSPMLDRGGNLFSVRAFSSCLLLKGYGLPFRDVFTRCFADSAPSESS